MTIEITMPRLSDTMEEGTLIKWHVKVGDRVSSGDVLADVETDKATMELQSYDDGTVARLALEESQTVPVGELILVLAEDGETVDSAASAATTPGLASAGGEGSVGTGGTAVSARSVVPHRAAAATTAVPPPAPQTPSGRIRVSPVARKLAEENGLDLATISGSGPDGRIIKRDVLAVIGTAAPPAAAPASSPSTASPSAATATPVERPAAQTIKVSNMRRAIARRLVKSKTTIPHFTVTVSANMDPLLALRKTLNEQLEPQGVKLSVNDFIVRAAAMALLQHPTVNSSWTESGIEQYGAVNVGVAVALLPPPAGSGGLVVPVIRDADEKGLRLISADTRALAARARDQGLTADEMTGGTFTISNLGMLGVEHFEAIINPPEAAILAVGAALARPVVRDDRIVVGHEMSCTLSADHRVIDGAMAAEFLQTIRQSLENPAVMLV